MLPGAVLSTRMVFGLPVPTMLRLPAWFWQADCNHVKNLPSWLLRLHFEREDQAWIRETTCELSFVILLQRLMASEVERE